MMLNHPNSLRLALIAMLTVFGVTPALAGPLPVPDAEVAGQEKAPEAALPADETKPLLLDPEAQKVETSCTSMYCGNTGTLWGFGPDGETPACTTAKADLRSEIRDAAYDICPGVVTGVTYNYDNNCVGVNATTCKTSGNGDISCKICPGQSCGLQF